MGEKLKFGQLAIGDRFIAFPQDGDNDGHGGYLSGEYVFMKTRNMYYKYGNMAYEARVNCINVSRGIESHCPDTMEVIKVIV